MSRSQEKSFPGNDSSGWRRRVNGSWKRKLSKSKRDELEQITDGILLEPDNNLKEIDNIFVAVTVHDIIAQHLNIDILDEHHWNQYIEAFGYSTESYDFEQDIGYTFNNFIRRIEIRDYACEECKRILDPNEEECWVCGSKKVGTPIVEQLKSEYHECANASCSWSKEYDSPVVMLKCPQCSSPMPRT